MTRRELLAVLAASPMGACAPRLVPPVAAPQTRPPRPPLPSAQPLGPIMLDGHAEQGALLRGVAPIGTDVLRLDGKAIDLATDRQFLVGFDRDAAPSALLEATGNLGARSSLPITVAPHAWRIENLPTLPKHAEPEPAFLALRQPELAAIAAARAIRTDAQGWRQRLGWPVHGRQTGWFGSQRIYAGEPGEYHGGADVAVPQGTPVHAPADGVVILAADHPFTLEGFLLMIDHGLGLTTALLHLSRIDVAVGHAVRQGEPVALSGRTGRATGPHLHWGLRWQAARIDPLQVAGPVPKD